MFSRRVLLGGIAAGAIAAPAYGFGISRLGAGFGRAGALRRKAAIAFSPGTLSAVKYWIDAGLITGVTDGSNITTAKLVDQSLSALGALATATATIYRANGGNGKPAVEFDGSTSVIVSPTFSVATNRREFIVLKPIAFTNQHYLSDGGALDQGSLFASNGTAFGQAFAANTLGTPVPLWGGWENGVYVLIDLVTNGASSSLQVSGQTLKTGNITTAGTKTKATLGAPGNLLGGFFGNLQVAEYIIADSTLTAPQATQIRNYLLAKHAIVTRKFLICDGNSLTLGTGSTGGTNGWPVQIIPLLTGGSGTWRVLNNGVGGQVTTAMDTQASTGGANTTDGYLGFYARTVVVGWEVSNDIIAGTSAATAYSNYTTFWANRLAANAAAKRVAVTCMKRTDMTGPQETARQTVNANILANWPTFADALIDPTADARLNDPTNLTFFADGIHLTDAGYAIFSGLMATAINAFG